MYIILLTPSTVETCGDETNEYAVILQSFTLGNSFRHVPQWRSILAVEIEIDWKQARKSYGSQQDLLSSKYPFYSKIYLCVVQVLPEKRKLSSYIYNRDGRKICSVEGCPGISWSYPCLRNAFVIQGNCTVLYVQPQLERIWYTFKEEGTELLQDCGLMLSKSTLVVQLRKSRWPLTRERYLQPSTWYSNTSYINILSKMTAHRQDLCFIRSSQVGRKWSCTTFKPHSLQDNLGCWLIS